MHFGFVVFLGLLVTRESRQDIMVGCKSGDSVLNLYTNCTPYTAIEFGVSMLLCKQPDSKSSLKYQRNTHILSIIFNLLFRLNYFFLSIIVVSK